MNLQFSICFSLNLSHESWCFAKNFSVLRTALLHWNLISGLIWNLLSSVFAFCEFWFLLLNLKFLFLILFFLLKSIYDIIHISCFLFKERCELTCTLFVLNFEISLIILFSCFRGPYWICTSLFLAKLPVKYSDWNVLLMKSHFFFLVFAYGTSFNILLLNCCELVSMRVIGFELFNAVLFFDFSNE